MADPYSSEQEQIQALKRWWDENGAALMVGVGIVIAVIFGGQWWRQHQDTGAQEATIIYDQLLQAVGRAGDDPVQRTTAETLAAQLAEQQAGARLGDYGALMVARLKVESGDLDAAASTLQALLERQPDREPGLLRSLLAKTPWSYVDPRIGALARVRLARVQFAQGKLDAAKATLDAATGEHYRIERLELKSDLLRAAGDTAGALAALDEALAVARATPDSAPGRILEMKREELALEKAPAAAAAAIEPAAPAAAPAAQQPAAAEEKTP